MDRLKKRWIRLRLRLNRLIWRRRCERFERKATKLLRQMWMVEAHLRLESDPQRDPGRRLSPTAARAWKNRDSIPLPPSSTEDLEDLQMSLNRLLKQLGR